MKLRQLTKTFEQLWPTSGAESWDAVGLVVGSPDSEVKRVLVSVDVTSEMLSEAIQADFDLVLAHHPAMLKGITTASEITAKGALLAKAIGGKVAVYSAHTNADIVSNGVSDTLAKAFGLQDLRPLVPTRVEGEGHGRIGSLPEEMSLGEFARMVATILPATATGVRVSGEYSQRVSKVALCGGAGDSFISHAAASQADVYLTADLRHHPAQEAREEAMASGTGMALIDVSHWASEWLWLDVAAQQLRLRHPEIEFEVSTLRTDPWDFVVTQ